MIFVHGRQVHSSPQKEAACHTQECPGHFGNEVFPISFLYNNGKVFVMD